jgi:hypothetical protein
MGEIDRVAAEVPMTFRGNGFDIRDDPTGQAGVAMKNPPM